MKRPPSNDLIPRSNLEYTEELYDLYLKDPEKLPPSWRWFFQGFHFQNTNAKSTSSTALPQFGDAGDTINLYREKGHLKAQLDPLNIWKREGFPEGNWSEKELNEPFKKKLSGHLSHINTLKDLIHVLEQSYCQKISLQAENSPLHIKQWLFKEMETPFSLNPEEKKRSSFSTDSNRRFRKIFTTPFSW